MRYLDFYNFIKISLIIGLLILGSLFIYQYPRPHNDTISALEYDHVSGLIVEEIDIEIDGRISKRLFGKDLFTGSIKIGEFEYNSDKNYPIYLDDKYQSQYLIQWPEQGLEIVNYGIYYTNEDLSQIIILKYERKENNVGEIGGTFGNLEGSIIYGPSTTKEDLMDGISSMIQNTYFKNLKIKW